MTKLYQVFVQVSCLNSALVEFICATGTGTITLPASGGAGTLVVPITPPIDPELTEIHDLSFIVTGSPTPVPTCRPFFNVTATPSIVTINRTATGGTAKVVKTIQYFGNCPGATISLTTVSKPLGLTVSVMPPVVTVPPSPQTVIEVITAGPNTAPGQYSVIETDTAGQVTVTVITTVIVI